MSLQEVTPEEMIPQVKISLTAQTVLPSHQLKGYKLYEITEERLK